MPQIGSKMIQKWLGSSRKFCALVLSSNHILAKAHKDFESESKAQADFQSLTKTAQKKTLYKSSAESVLESKGAVDFQVLAKLTGKNAITNIDFKGLAKLELKSAITNCTEIYNRINLLIRKTQYPYIKRCLTGCSANYQDAIGLIKKSLANIWIAGASAYSTACEDSFQELVHQNSPIADMKTQFDQLSSSALKQINSLVKRGRLITEGCSQTLDKELCKCTVEFFLENKGLGLQGMAKLAVENALKYGTKIHNHISKLLKTTLDINIHKNLKSCSEFYMSATDKIKDSLPALDSKRYSDASTWVGAATDWAETCEDIFAGKSHVTSMKTEFEKLVSIALAVIKKLAGN
ncbi:hypothetical protein D5086_009795 [Populus alba]|uniref:Uncharacterized protein n=2 Tax=Populus alba TaxID=43335 RepID=A0ACC4C883_POPAL|nr:hypothetical protein D5086_0000050070 [Populus alba]